MFSPRAASSCWRCVPDAAAIASVSAIAARASRRRMANTWAAPVHLAASARWPARADSLARPSARLASVRASSASAAADSKRCTALDPGRGERRGPGAEVWSWARAAATASSSSRLASAGWTGAPFGGPVGGFHESGTGHPSGDQVCGTARTAVTQGGSESTYRGTPAKGPPRLARADAGRDVIVELVHRGHPTGRARQESAPRPRSWCPDGTPLRSTGGCASRRDGRRRPAAGSGGARRRAPDRRCGAARGSGAGSPPRRTTAGGRR